EPRGRVGRDIALWMDGARLREQLLLGLGVVRIRHAAVHGTHRGALLLIEKAHALRALLRDDVINVLLEGGMALPVALPRRAALVDGGVRALRLARPAVDALRSDHRRHGTTSSAGLYRALRRRNNRKPRPSARRGRPDAL